MAIENHFTGQNLTGPATRAEAVTPSDSADLTRLTRALWVGGTGNISVVMEGGQTVTIEDIPAGTWMPIRVSRVRSTSTTATKIVAFD